MPNNASPYTSLEFSEMVRLDVYIGEPRQKMYEAMWMDDSPERLEHLGIGPWSALIFRYFEDLANLGGSLLEEDKDAPALLFFQNQMTWWMKVPSNQDFSSDQRYRLSGFLKISTAISLVLAHRGWTYWPIRCSQVISLQSMLPWGSQVKSLLTLH